MRIITDYQTVDTHAEPAPLGRECERQVHLTRLRRGRMRVAGQSQPDVARQIVDDRAGPAVQPAKKFLAAEEGAVESDQGNRAPGNRADTFGEGRDVRAGIVCEARHWHQGLLDPFNPVATHHGLTSFLSTT